MFARLFRKLSWFGAVGLVSTSLYVASVFLLVELAGLSPMASNIIAVAITAIWSYLGHHYLTFQAEGEHQRYVPRFIVQMVISYSVSSTITYLAQVMGWHYLIGVALIVGVIPLMNFIVFQTWVFAKSG